MSERLLRVAGLVKRYPASHSAKSSLGALWRLLRGKQPKQTVTILDGIDFEVSRGQSLAIIGENGAGKSTLLKIVGGVIEPTEGVIERQCRVGTLIELAAGFHGEYTGRQNVRMQAALYGLSGDHLERRMHEIESFADIGAYFDEPVKHYSTGMMVRLGFAIIANVRPPLLITDEVLSVGDESFQKKCIKWLDAYIAEGGTLLMVSHSMYHVQKLCAQVLWLEKGRVRMFGDASELVREYMAWHDAKINQEATDESPGGTTEYQVISAVWNDVPAEGKLRLEMGGELRLEARVRSKDGSQPALLMGIVHADGTPVFGVSSEMDGAQPQPTEDGDFIYRMVFPEMPLQPGRYRLRVHAMDTQAMRHFDTMERDLTVVGESREYGVVRLSHHWR